MRMLATQISYESVTPLVNRNTMPAALEVQKSVKFRTYSSSGSSKVDGFGTNRKHICEFLLVINSNFGPILHRFCDTATYWLKIAYFSYPSSYSRPPLPIFPLELQAEVKRQETRVMGLLCGEGCVILTSTVFD